MHKKKMKKNKNGYKILFNEILCKAYLFKDFNSLINPSHEVITVALTYQGTCV